MDEKAQPFSKVTDRVSKLSDKINKPARASLFYTLSSISSRAAAFLFTPIFTRLFTGEQYGAYQLFGSYLTIITIVGSMEICGGVLYRLLQKNQKNEASIIASAELLTLITTLLTLGVFIFISSYKTGELFYGFYISLAIAALSRVIIALFISSQRYRYKYSFIIAINLWESIGSPLFTLLFYKIGVAKEHYASTRALVFAFVLLCAAIPILIYSFSKKRVTEPKALRLYFPDILKAALPMLPYYISMIAISQADRVIISRVLDTAAVGKYTVAYALGGATTMICSGAVSVLTPWIMRKLRSGALSDARQILHMASIIISLMTLALLCFAPELFSFLAPSGYSDALILVYPISLSAVPLFLVTLQSAAALSYEGRLGIILSGLIPACLSIALNIILLPRIGIIASAITVPISYLTAFIISSLNLKHISGKSPIKVSSCLQIVLFSSLFATILYQARSETFTRVIIFITVLAIAAFMLPEIKKYIKEA